MKKETLSKDDIKVLKLLEKTTEEYHAYLQLSSIAESVQKQPETQTMQYDWDNSLCFCIKGE